MPSSSGGRGAGSAHETSIKNCSCASTGLAITYDSSRPFKAWFFKIASNLLIDDRRLAFRSHEVVLEERTVALPVGIQNHVAAREQLASILDRLSPAERHVLVRSIVHGVGYPQLARELGKSVSAVKKMASRALQRVRVSPQFRIVESGLRAR